MSVRRLAGFLVALLASSPAGAAPIRDFPVVLSRPDGSRVDLLLTGDEYDHRVHDADGYTVVQDPASRDWVYATPAGDGLAPTACRVGECDPRAFGLFPGATISPDLYRQRVVARTLGTPLVQRSSPTTGTVNNLVIFIRFSDEAEFEEPLANYESMLNANGPDAVSLRSYYTEVSYGRVDVVSHFFPQQAPGGSVLSYQDSHPRAYYKVKGPENPAGYTDELERADREQTLLRDALLAIAPQVPADLNLDGDADGNVDSVDFVISGREEGWSDLLWPHATLMIFHEIYLNEARVLHYDFQLASFLAEGRGVGVLAHELFHSMGAPDLYHYSQDKLAPAGPWDLMEYDGTPPQHMSAAMKWRHAGWIPDIPVITQDGAYTLKSLLEPEGNAYRIPIPGTSQWLVLEYRRNIGRFEVSLPASGLLIWRLDTTCWGNQGGPPDELYVFRPGGTPKERGDLMKAHFSGDAGRTRFDPATDPKPFTNEGKSFNIRVFDVGPAGDTISFRVCLKGPQCDGKVCGDDGCGETCGTCPDGQACIEGGCWSPLDCAALKACLDACASEGCRKACDQGPVRCPPPGPCQAPGACDPEAGACAFAVAVGQPCDDGDPCTGDDRCDADGSCRGTGACVPDEGPVTPDGGTTPDDGAVPGDATDPGTDPGSAIAEEALPDAGPGDPGTVPDAGPGTPDAAPGEVATLPDADAPDALAPELPGPDAATGTDLATSADLPAKKGGKSGCSAGEGSPWTAASLLLPALAVLLRRRNAARVRAP